jgi:hypothetical protein
MFMVIRTTHLVIPGASRNDRNYDTDRWCDVSRCVGLGVPPWVAPIAVADRLIAITDTTCQQDKQTYYRTTQGQHDQSPLYDVTGTYITLA